MNVEITKATTDEEVKAIADLQQANLRKNLSPAEMEQFGFVTLEYTYEVFKEMTAGKHHIIAKDGEKVVGYCLLFDLSKKHLMTKGVGVFSVFNELIYKGIRLGDTNYVMVGQVCVDRTYAGLGILGRMYAAFKEAYKSNYDFAMTDIASSNHRSLKGHIKAGFDVIHSFQEPDADEQWDIVVWDWRE